MTDSDATIAKQRQGIYIRLCIAFEQRPGEALRTAAKRIVRTRGPQIMAAQVLLSGDEGGEAAWDRMERALKAADDCKWVKS